MHRFTGKTAFITGAARGQGRSHALRLAQEGADIIAVDICAPIESATYDLATPADLEHTVSLVEQLGRRIVARTVDTRDLEALSAAAASGAAELGGIDVVIANAGIACAGEPADAKTVFDEVLEVNLTGTWNTLRATAPLMIEQGRGGAIVLTSSTQGLTGRGGAGIAGNDAYAASKHGMVGLMRSYAHALAPHWIRVNSIHPTGVDTPMIKNPAIERLMSENIHALAGVSNLLDVLYVEPSDISAAIAWITSDEGRYVTGVTLPVDAGFAAK
jgi:SDR family mycofactocin-dependent oxidoreductase